MTDRKQLGEVARWLMDEHHEVGRLRKELGRLTQTPSGSRDEWLAELKRAFDELHTRVLHHFELEEMGGYLSQVVEARPTLSPRVDYLAAEHRQLRPILLNLQQMLCLCRPEDHLLQADCCVRIRSLLQTLGDHEAREGRVVQDTHATDLGAAD